MLEGIAIGDKADKEATQKRFEERQKRLWEVSAAVPYVPMLTLPGYQRGHPPG